MKWIRIESTTQFPKDKKILLYSFDGGDKWKEMYEHNYEVMGYSHTENEEGSPPIQVWRTECGDVINGTMQWFDQHILGKYSHYLVLEHPKHSEEQECRCQSEEYKKYAKSNHCCACKKHERGNEK